VISAQDREKAGVSLTGKITTEQDSSKSSEQLLEVVR
jgi:hypothetical protein